MVLLPFLLSMIASGLLLSPEDLEMVSLKNWSELGKLKNAERLTNDTARASSLHQIFNFCS